MQVYLQLKLEKILTNYIKETEWLYGFWSKIFDAFWEIWDFSEG